MILGSARIVARWSPPPSCIKTIEPGSTAPSTRCTIWRDDVRETQSRGSTLHVTTSHPLAFGFLQHGVIEATPGGTEQPRRDPESVEGMRRLPDLIGDPLPGEIGQRRIDRVIP